MEKDIIVQKFGGSSVENTEKLKLVSEHIIKEYKEGNKVTVIVSAQGKTTDKLIQEEQEITNNPIAREHDVLVSTGEQITIAKLAIMLNSMGYKAISFTGWQIPIVTDGNFKDAKIKYINSDKIKKYLNDGYIVIIAGFQGIDEENNITTLGRGGSDTTAVAVAAALNAAKCEIYTDVDGVFELDPRKNPNVKTVYKIISVIITVAICVSTLTTRQHVIVDVAGGIALAEFSYLIVDKIGFTRIYQRSMKYIEQRISR